MKIKKDAKPQTKAEKTISTVLSLILCAVLLLAAGIPSYSMARGLATLIAEDNDHVYVVQSVEQNIPVAAVNNE